MIIDTDPGADDVVALLLALASPEALNVLAITTVAGNVRLDKTSRNACLAREWAGRADVPVYAGADRPLQRAPIYAEDIHGEEGLPGLSVYAPEHGLAEGGAVEYLVWTLSRAAPHSITLAMLGPQTNLALALGQAPEIARGIREVIVMGGAQAMGGNITPAAEFNLHADPHAADVVLASGVKLVYLSLDVTHRMLTSEARFRQLAALGNRAGELVVAILEAYVATDMERYGLSGGPVHDACVIAYLLQPGMFRGRQVRMSIDCGEGPTLGQTRVADAGASALPANALWIEDGDAQAFFDLLCARLVRLD
nr:nucleoside hydrolase [Pseudomonas akapageensis]